MTKIKLRSYHLVNREERFYCMLIAHCLLSSKSAREGFAKVVHDEAGLPGIFSNSSEFEVFMEVAALRDYWRELGDPKRYDPAIEQARRDFLEKALRWVNGLEDGAKVGWSQSPPDLLDKKRGSPFWTEKKDGSPNKLCSPALWPIKKLNKADSTRPCVERLKRLRWAFNAKPDLLVLGGQHGVLIEVKVESGGGQNKDGYKQLPTQANILSLWKHFDLPGLNGNISLVTLGKGPKPSGSEHHMKWKQLIEGIGVKNMDPFTARCLGRFNG